MAWKKQRSEKLIYEEQGKLWTVASRKEGLSGKQALDWSEKPTYGCGINGK